jgi:hypothetical protein
VRKTRAPTSLPENLALFDRQHTNAPPPTAPAGGFGALHRLHASRNAKHKLPHCGHVQSPSRFCSGLRGGGCCAISPLLSPSSHKHTSSATTATTTQAPSSTVYLSEPELWTFEYFNKTIWVFDDGHSILSPKTNYTRLSISIHPG